VAARNFSKNLSERLNLALSWLAPLLAFAVYGSWACWVHRHESGAQSLHAGIAQGSYAVLSTIALRHVVLALHRRFAGFQLGRIWTFSLSFALILLLPFALHSALGNTRPWLAIAPGVAFGSTYIALILWGSGNTNNVA
jgi:hypothetical protein